MWQETNGKQTNTNIEKKGQLKKWHFVAATEGRTKWGMVKK